MGKQKVILGMSGGVDSSVAAHLLQAAGYEVMGVTMRLVPDSLGGSAQGVTDAEQVARQLGIPFAALDLRAEFERLVMTDFARAYYQGRTPNPCILCNSRIKFGLFAQYAWQLGGDYIATGHYAKIAQAADGRWQLRKGDDPAKDQSYFLFGIPRALLGRILFPLSRYSKGEIRQIAGALRLPVAEKRDSQEICFVTDNDYKRFLSEFDTGGPSVPGQVVDAQGKVLGSHQGIENYTIGQRKGLGIALGKPAYVVAIDVRRHQVVLGEGQALLADTLTAVDNNFLAEVPVGQPLPIAAKVRYRAQPAAAVLTRLADGSTRVVFAEPQRAITPGQGVCYYLDDVVLGGGIIDKIGQEV